MDKNPWYAQQLRIIQTVLREIDLINYDAQAVVNYLESASANCLVINAGGIIDFFPNPIELNNPSRFLGQQDILQELTAACRKKNIRVIARVDFRGVERRIYDQRPDAFSVGEDGKPLVFKYLGEALPETLYTPCYLSWYRNQHAFEFARHLLEKYNVDGIWENAPMFEGVCYCKACTSAFKEDIGEPIPRGGNYADARYDRYKAWKASNLQKHLLAFRQEIKRFGADKAYCAEIFGLFYDFYNLAGHDLYSIKDAMDFLVTPLFVANQEPLNAPATLTKFLNALDPNKTPVILFGHLGTDNQQRYVSNSPAELKIWLWEAVSSGASLWNVIFNGQHPGATHDRRNEKIVTDVFRKMAKHQAQLHRQRAVAPVSIFFSQKTSLKRRNSDRSLDHFLTNILGVEQCLLDRHIQYDFVADRDFSLIKLQDKKLLILPNCEFLSDAEIQTIREYVAEGGKIISTGRTSLSAPEGQLRDDFGLADVFGCSYSGHSVDASKWGYQRVRADQHEIFAGIVNTELLANWGENLLVRSGAGGKVVATLVPPIYPQPPEKSWLASLDSSYPAIVDNCYQNGRSIYFASEIDRNLWHRGHLDFDSLLGNAVQCLLQDEHPLSTNAPASVRAKLTRIPGESSSGFFLHLINTSSSPRRPVAEIIPVTNIVVSLTLPAETFESFNVVFGDPEVTSVRSVGLRKGLLSVQVRVSTLTDFLSVCIATS